MKRFWLCLLTALCLILLTSCSGARMMMQTAPSTAKGASAQPPIATATLEQWTAQKFNIRQTLEHEVYGVMPADFTTTVTDRRPLTNHDYSADIEELTLTASTATQSGAAPISYRAVLLTPKAAQAPVPIIMMENFCPNHNVIPNAGVSQPPNIVFSCDEKGLNSKLIRFVFGRYITSPPIEDILTAGYGLGVIYPSSVYPDNANWFQAPRQAAPDPQHPWGAVAAWAYQFSSFSHALGALGHETTIAYGHSRYGKSALLAAAYDESIDAVIAHQSGTGGASLSRQKKGETVLEITQSYPHWFTPPYSEENLTYDQHHLLALIAPRPLLLGNAKRDVWSDPEGAFRAARGATPIYQLYGQNGLEQETLTSFNPNADIAFWMRKGTHGVVKEDWPAFIEFLNAHFAP